MGSSSPRATPGKLKATEPPHRAGVPGRSQREFCLDGKGMPICSGFEQNPRQVRKPGGGRLMKRRVASGLRHIDIRALLDQQAHGLTILAQGNTSMQRLVVHRDCARSGAHARRG